MKNIVYNTAIWLCLILSLSSCEREFDNNDDFNLNEPADIFENNDLLFNKIFQFTTGGTYLWFDIRNEIADFSRPVMNITYVLNPEGGPNDQITMTKRIDFRGRLYRYNSEKEELIILDYPLDIVTGTDIPADIVFNFSRKQKEGCDMITDVNQRLQCERTFALKTDRIEFKEIDFVMPVGTPVTYGSRNIQLQNSTLDLLLTN